MDFDELNCYKRKSGLLPGHSYASIVKVAWVVFKGLSSQTKRRPYIRSAYFMNKKIFLDNFWPHLMQKNPTDRKFRLRFLKGAVELMRNSVQRPVFVKRDEIRHEILYRFLGKASEKYFVVQIKMDLKRNQLLLMSCFEYEK
jgi:hypothetical protein